MLSSPAYPLLTAEQFLDFSFGDRKAELDEGVVRVLDGVTRRHASVQGNLLEALHRRLQGTRFSLLGSSLPIATSERSVRRADLLVVFGKDGPEHDNDRVLDDPVVVFEIVHLLPPRTNLMVKLAEYRRLSALETIVLVDAAAERLRVVQRTGPSSWSDVEHEEPVDLPLPALGVTLPHADIFAR